MRNAFELALIGAAIVFAACREREPRAPAAGGADSGSGAEMEKRLAQYTTVRLSSDLSGMDEKQRKMLQLFIEACRQMDDAFWIQAYGDKQQLLSSISDPAMRRFAEINYGPWDRLQGNEPFVPGAGPKPPGANFYPRDMSKEEFEAAAGSSPDLKGTYSVVRRNAARALEPVPYHESFAAQIEVAAAKLEEAAGLAADTGLARYLRLRAQALRTDEYRESDMAWLDMKDNDLDVVIGPIETYEDQLFGYKAAFEGYVLIKDRAWSDRLRRYAAMLPGLQRDLPVPEEYKREQPGTDSDLNAYDVLFYAGDCNAGSKTIAINLPNDEQVQLRKGTRRLQLKNAMRAKFDKILMPIARQLVAESQLPHVTFDAFFNNTMFHEVAHGLGIKNTLGGKGTVREALREQASAIEEGKADVLGLYMVTRLHDQGELPGGSLEDHYVTFMASIFRSIRFGSSSAHGQANLVRFNFFEQRGAFVADSGTGAYRMELQEMRQAIDALSETLLRLQGDGDYEGVRAFMEEKGTLGPKLRQDLDQLASAGVPVDVVFEQGPEVLGLE